MSLIQPKFIAIDSSILASWAQDIYSENPKTNHDASSSLKSLFNANWIPVICWHHFEELVRHHEEQVAIKRITFLESFPSIVWLPNLKLPSHLGSIVEVFDAEVQALLSSPDCEISQLCALIRQDLFRYGSPSEIETFSLCKEVRPFLEAKATREQEIASVMHAKEATDGKTKVFELKNTQAIDNKVTQLLFSQQEAELADEIAKRGDQRIASPQNVANEFTSKVAADFEEIIGRGGEPLITFLQQYDVPIDDVNSNTTLEELKEGLRGIV